MGNNNDVQMKQVNDQKMAEQMENNVQQAEEISYTRDEDFDEFTDKDETTEVIGYVDKLHAPVVVGSKQKYDLFKFTLNNASNKRIVCLVWGKPLIEQYVGIVSIGKKLQIEGAVAKAVSQTFYKASNNLVPFELLINNGTLITDHGDHNAAQENMEPQQVQVVTFENVGKTKGLLSIEGYIKMMFVRMESNFKSEAYGCGAITDGQYKLTVHISNYTSINIEKGVLVKVIGEIDLTGARPMILKCRDENSVVEVPGAPKMSAADLARGVKTPKRGHE